MNQLCQTPPSGPPPTAGACQARAHALQVAHLQLQALFDLSPVGKVQSRFGDGRLLDVNEVLATMLGLTRDAACELRMAELLPPAARHWLRRWTRELLLHGRFGPCEAELRHASGRLVPVQLWGMPAVLPDGSRRVWIAVQDLSDIRQIETRLRHEARTDRLTGLPNRALLIERLQQMAIHAVAHAGHRFAVLFLDLDHFKRVNDMLGHEAGDDLLQRTADRLRRVLRGADAREPGPGLVARLGGDEFVVLLDGIADAEAAARVAQRLLAALAVPYQVAGRELHVTASIGIAVAVADDVGADGHDSDPLQAGSTLLRQADIALHEAKRAGRNGHAFYDASMHERLARTVRIEAGLRRAIALAQLSIVYQPIVELASGQMTSVEALARWQDAELGAVSPAEFIPVAEESGLVVPLGEWVLRQACSQWRAWQDLAPGGAPAAVSVNLSRAQMALGDRLVELVQEVLHDAEMPAAALQLEVTEREVMRDPGAMLGLMQRLRGLGVRLAMDDFGTGASSLGCLRDLPFDVIKIDKSFVDELGCREAATAVLEGAVMLIRRLGIDCVAEGVESALQHEALRNSGCRFGQGYLYSRPVAANRIPPLAMATRLPT